MVLRHKVGILGINNYRASDNKPIQNNQRFIQREICTTLNMLDYIVDILKHQKASALAHLQTNKKSRRNFQDSCSIEFPKFKGPSHE